MGLESIRIKVLSDGSFSGNDDGSSQDGYMIFFTDSYNTANHMEYDSITYSRVLISVVGAET